MIYYLSSAINRLYICSAIMSHAWEPLVKGPPRLALNENWPGVLKSYLLQILDYFQSSLSAWAKTLWTRNDQSNLMPVTELLKVQFIQRLHQSENSNILRFAWRSRMLFKIGLSIRTLFMCKMSIKSSFTWETIQNSPLMAEISVDIAASPEHIKL